MTHHLSPQEFVEAIEHGLGGARAHHLDACGDCQRGVLELRALMHEATSGADVPEPSPLFWEHFSARVRTATSVEAGPGRRPGWLSGWRAVLAVGGLAGAVALALVVQSPYSRRAPSPQAIVASNGVAPSAAEPALEDGSWDFIVLLASDLSADDLHRMAPPVPGGADSLASNLTAEQQKELVRLLKAEMGGAE